jgi:hypothetical protein
VSQDYALDRVRARRRPPKPPGQPPWPPWWPWWLSALFALVNIAATVLNLMHDSIGWAAFSGVVFCLNGTQAIREWQWRRYNRWKGGRS